MASETIRMSIDVPKDLHRLIKYSACFEKRSIRDFVIEAIRDRLKEKVEAQQSTLAAQYGMFQISSKMC